MSSTIKRKKRSLDQVENNVGGKIAWGEDDVDSKNVSLRGVVACLTGLTHDKKIHFHEMIESLGGRYTRDFDLDQNTHLIAEIAQGAKYDLAMSCPRIHIVKSSWLLSCSQEGKREDEAFHSLRAKPSSKPTNTANAISQIDDLIERQVGFFTLFEMHKFYLLGFEKDIALKNRLGKLMRRGKGTIYWEMNEEISIIIMHDTCDSSLRKAVKTLTENHVNMPSAVSPAWVLESCKNNVLALPCRFPPVELAPTNEKDTKMPSKLNLSRSNSASAVFRGCLFSLVRIAPPNWAVDFDSRKQESFIKSHGGQMLSFRLIDAMRVDASKSGQRRKCHVVCWGGRPQLQLNPILSQLKRDDLCDIALVTPMWIQTCIRTQKRVSTEAIPLALMPQPWPLRKQESTIFVALTGFSGTEKIALSFLIKSIGGSVTEDMNKTNTHLLCKQKANKLKVEKASQWGMHIVSIDWLSHILEHGFCGIEKEKIGCEHRFEFQGVTA